MVFVALFYTNIVLAAPITSWATVTAVTNADGSYYNPTQSVVAGAETAGATVATAVTPASVATSSAASAGLTSLSSGGWVDILKNALSLLINDDGSLSTTSSSSGSDSLFSFSSLLKLLFGSSSSDSTLSSDLTTTAVATQTTSTILASTLPSTTSAATSTSSSGNLLIAALGGSGSSTSSASTLTLTNGIYDAIYNSNEEIDESFAKEILDAHNKVRALHGSGPLSWDNGPYSYAKNNADNYDCSGILTHTHGQYGENLAAGFKTGTSALMAWYDEGQTYDYSSANTYDHFTQVVWKDSTKVGCAYKDCTSSGWGLYIVCEYDPVGNVIGQNSENVLPLV